MAANLPVPVAHIDEPDTINALLNALRTLHGPTYHFAVGRWAGTTRFVAPPGMSGYRFVIESHEATVQLQPTDCVRGAAPEGPYRTTAADQADVTAEHWAALWPGDVVTASTTPVMMKGSGVFFEVITEATDYDAPRAVFLRHLSDHPGGCAAYPGAFRREALPPHRTASAANACGVNRINEHTLDMRFDRQPPPIRHYHGPVLLEDAMVVNHSETALVLPRAVYDLPAVADTVVADAEEGHLLIYPRPAEDPGDIVRIPVRPGSLVVTPATAEHAVGHCFENCFAMLVAIPGFVAPYHQIEQ